MKIVTTKDDAIKAVCTLLNIDYGTVRNYGTQKSEIEPALGTKIKFDFECDPEDIRRCRKKQNIFWFHQLMELCEALDGKLGYNAEALLEKEGLRSILRKYKEWKNKTGEFKNE